MLDVVAEFGRFCTEVIAPINQVGDIEAARYDDATYYCEQVLPQARALFPAVKLPSTSSTRSGPISRDVSQ